MKNFFSSDKLLLIPVILLGLALPKFSFGATAQSTSSSAAGNGSTLDQKAIHEKYNDGDFDAVILAIEKFRQGHASYSRTDSTFIAKHLAVVYSANPATREKGKYYMYQLLEMLPSAKLVDMYVSDEIDRIFEKVREEFVARQQSFGVDSTQMNIPHKAPVTPTLGQVARREPEQTSQSKATGSKSHTTYWMAGAAAGIAAAGVIVYFVLSTPDNHKSTVYVVQ